MQEEALAFRIGDVVQLKSGSRDMTVEASGGGETMCAWHSDDGHAQREKYADEMLIDINDIEAPPMPQVDYGPL